MESRTPTASSFPNMFQQLRAGDDRAISILWEQYFKRMLFVARKKLCGAQRRIRDEEDIALSALKSFCIGFRKGRFECDGGEYDLWPLLVTLTINKTIDHLRRENRKKRTPKKDAPALVEDLVSGECTPDLQLIADESFAELLAALGETGDTDLAAIALFKLEDLPTSEIASELGCTVPHGAAQVKDDSRDLAGNRSMNGPLENGPDALNAWPSRLSNLPPEQLLRINRCCDEYERLWRENGNASLRDFLPHVQSDDRQDAVCELVLIDIELRRHLGLVVTAEYYLLACPTLNRTWLDQQLTLPIANTRQITASGLVSGQRIGDYVIREPLGEGGMGSVYRAEHVLMKRPVAIKIIQQQGQSNLLLQRRFEREVRTLAKLSHPNVVTAFDARQESGWLYLITELIEGVDLGRLVRDKGRLTPTKATHYVWQAANGLHFAHTQGIIHRDIKPENLFLDRHQKIKVLDLGLARLSSPDSNLSDDASLTESSQILGTASYMSPEQARAPATADARSDIYSLGCTLFFLLTGSPPYLGESPVDTILAHVGEPVPSVADFVGGQHIPPQLNELVKRMMAKAPQSRPSSMRVVVDELAKIFKQLQSHPQSASPTLTEIQPVPMTKTQRTFNRRKLLWLFSLVVSTPCIAFVAYLTLSFLSNRTVNSGPDLSTPNGLKFNGTDNYVEVPKFNESMNGHVAIEAVVRPSSSVGIASIVSWTGPQSLVLFRSAGNEWGVAFFDGVTARLIVASQTSPAGVMRLVAAVWDGEQLSLHVDGKPIEVYPIEYEMIPAPSKLFIGGIPDGIIPSHQGTRYFEGEISAVRVSRSTQPIRIATDPSMLIIRPETLALFDFRKPTHLHTVDQTKRWRAQLRGN